MSDAGRRPREVIIGLDVGTTATKVVAFGLDAPGQVTAEREYRLHQPAPGQHVQDPEVVAEAVRAALAECARRLAGAAVVALSVSTGMHGLIGLGSDRRPVTPLLTWADARAADEARWLHETGAAEDLYARSGTPVHPMAPLAKLLWFARHDPETARRVRWWVGLKDYVLALLTGALVTELSSASGTGLLDLATGDWSPRTLALVGVDRERLPPVESPLQTRALRADVAAQVGLPSGLPVVLGAGDGPLATVGVGALSPGVVGLSLGTSGAARTVVSQPWLDPQRRLFCYALTPQHWVVGGAVSNGAVVLQWLQRLIDGGQSLDEPDPDAFLAAATDVPAGSDGVVVLPYLLAERAPLWDTTLTGAVVGLRHRHTRAHLIRAGVEGVALNLALVVEQLHRVQPVTEIRATGAALASPLWRSVLAGMLGRDLVVPSRAGGTALGAAALGLVALGRVLDLSVAVHLLGARTEETTARADVTDVAAYRQMRAALPGLLDSYAAVAALLR